jgi:hypothetical protein
MEKIKESKKSKRSGVVKTLQTSVPKSDTEKPVQTPSLVASRDNPFFEGLAKALSI